MAFCILADITIEPKMALYEYAATNGELAAWNVLHIFRYLDSIDPRLYVDMALNRATALPETVLDGAPADIPSMPSDFFQPIGFYNFARPFILKIALLETKPVLRHERMIRLLEWMHQDYLFGAPGVIFATVFMSPSREGRMIKGINSSDRNVRLKGVNNAAWDVAFLQQWLKLINDASKPIFLAASSDIALLCIGRRMLATTGQTEADGLAGVKAMFRADWNPQQADAIIECYERLVGDLQNPSRACKTKKTADDWKAFTSSLEAQI
jgi:hypothetical protein